ncbi:MAG TPA: DUF2905 family protein [Blastocatellia bacterium]|nr:DUF2905 family protein [Blastocatellia bacterium]
MDGGGVQLGRWLIVFGIVFVVVGILFVFGGKLSWLRLGRLPGDFAWGRGSVRIYFPLMTSILLSLILTLIFWLFRK